MSTPTNKWPSVPFSPWSNFDPPADLPADLKAIYERAAALVLIAEGFCSWPERFNSTPEHLSAWSQPLDLAYHALAGWLTDHEAELRAEAPEVLTACQGILGMAERLAVNLSSLISVLAPRAADPIDAHLVTLVDTLRQNSARNGVQLAHALLDGIMVAADVLAELRSALCAWARSRQSATMQSFIEAVSRHEELPPSGKTEDKPHADGPEGGRWLWWNNKRDDVPKGVLYRLLEYMWNRESANYDELYAGQNSVYEDPVTNQTIRSNSSALNKILDRVGVNWRLTCNSLTRHITKQVGPVAKKKRPRRGQRQNP